MQFPQKSFLKKSARQNYTDAENEAIMDHLRPRDEYLARAMNRTVGAIRVQRVRLLKKLQEAGFGD